MRELTMNISRFIFLVLFGLTLNVYANSSTSPLQDVISGTHRTEANVLCDGDRHPARTLRFFGLEEDMTIVEIWPSSGWYTKILVPYVRGNGVYFGAGYALTAKRTPNWRKNSHKKLVDRLGQKPEVYDHVALIPVAYTLGADFKSGPRTPLENLLHINSW
jgi:predicted methyltransferase